MLKTNLDVSLALEFDTICTGVIRFYPYFDPFNSLALRLMVNYVG